MACTTAGRSPLRCASWMGASPTLVLSASRPLQLANPNVYLEPALVPMGSFWDPQNETVSRQAWAAYGSWLHAGSASSRGARQPLMHVAAR